MKKFNLNDYMYIQITDEGWKHLEKKVGIDYINACIKTPHYTHVINGETWYRLQCWNCFDLMPPDFGGRALFNTNVMFDDEALK
jgi:hypothetical protein